MPMTPRSRRRRAGQILTAALLLAAICACAPRETTATDPPSATAAEAPAPTAAPTPAAPIVLPDSLMPLAEGGQAQPRSPETSTLSVVFPSDQFDTVRSRVQTWMPANGWTLVAGSETDSARTAASLEELGQHAAAELARATPSYGASYQQQGHTVAVNLMTVDGALTLSFNWF